MLVVDLFCGCGGFSTGAFMAGHEVVLAIDNWEDALDTHYINHPNATHINMELGGNLEECAKLIKSYVGRNKWHLHGSPPCQSLSIANRTKNSAFLGMKLVDWYLDLVKLCKPTSWSMEQVIAAKKYLEPRGYICNIINTVDYLVPQTRKRLFIGSGWVKPKPLGSVNLSTKLPYLRSEGDLIKGYKNTVAVKDSKGNHSHNRKIQGLEGFKTIDEPTYTLCAAGPLTLYKFTSSGPEKVRKLSVKECLKIQGFPETYKFPDNTSKTSIYKQLGNAVSPPIAYLIMIQL